MRDQVSLIESAGFREVECVGMTNVKTSDYTIGALFKAIACK